MDGLLLKAKRVEEQEEGEEEAVEAVAVAEGPASSVNMRRVVQQHKDEENPKAVAEEEYRENMWGTIESAAFSNPTSATGECDWLTLHRRMGHVALPILQQLVKNEMVAGIRVKGEPNEVLGCPAFMQAKFTRYLFSSSEATAKAPLDEVVMDVVGPLKLGAAGERRLLPHDLGRANRTITETARGLLIEAGLPDTIWPDAGQSACVAKNSALTHVGADKWVSYVEWIGRKPKVDMLRVFGCMCMALVPKHLRHNKLGAKAIWAVHLGMAQNSKGWLLRDPFTKKFLWKKATESELKSIEENGTWELVELPEGRKAITSKWLFKIKSNADGKIERYKSRLVAKGHHQKEKVDYNDLFAPMVKPTMLRTLLAGAAIKGWVVKQMDVTTAFLNAILEEEIFMAQPQGCVKPWRRSGSLVQPTNALAAPSPLLPLHPCPPLPHSQGKIALWWCCRCSNHSRNCCGDSLSEAPAEPPDEAAP
ncbi:unnamed protein product [Closterium sp. NIES-54]